MANIYMSDWTPRGVRKNWERCSIGNDSAHYALGEWCKGNVIDACAWFDENDSLRVMVADTDRGHRMTYRHTAKGVTIASERKV